MGRKIERQALAGAVPDGVFRIMDGSDRLVALYGPPKPTDESEIAARAVRVLRPFGQDGVDEAT
jgi:hypothetical protein